MIKIKSSEHLYFNQVDELVQGKILNTIFKPEKNDRFEFIRNNMYGEQDVTHYILSLKCKYYDLYCFEIRKEIRPSLDYNIPYCLLYKNGKILIHGFDSEIVDIDFWHNSDFKKFEEYLISLQENCSDI